MNPHPPAAGPPEALRRARPGTGRLLLLLAVLWAAALCGAARLWASDPPRGSVAAEAAREGPTPAAALDAGLREARVGERAPRAPSLGSGDGLAGGVPGALRRGLLLVMAWTLLAVTLIIVAVTLGRTIRWLRRVSSIRRGPLQKVFQLRLNVRTSSGQVRHYSFESYPVTVSSAGTADLLLPSPRGIRQGFRIDYRDGQGWFASDSPLVINGVPQRTRQLREGDRILLGSYRIDFEGACFVARPEVLPSRPRYLWLAPAVAALLIISVLFRQASGIPQERADLRLARSAERAAERQAQRLEREAEREAQRARREAERLAVQAEREAEQQAAAERAAQEAERLAEAQREAEAERAAQEAERQAAAERAAEAEQAALEAQRAAQEAQEAERLAREAGQVAAAQRAAEAPWEAERAAAAQRAAEVERVAAAQRAAEAKRAAEAERAAAQGAAQEAERAAKAAREAERVAAAQRAAEAKRAAEAERAAAQRAAQEAERAVKAARDAEARRVAEAERVAEGERAARKLPPTLVAAMATDLPASTVAPDAFASHDPAPVASIAAVEDRVPAGREERPKPDAEPTLARAQVRTYAPGQPVAFFKADVLFIHAHPDDESLDFGVLMSRAFRSGRRIATVLFTDGESGLDRYPRRVVAGPYPNHSLRGAALASVRVGEAAEAMAILGSEAYVRLGLENRPYNTLRDVVPLETVLAGWGGERALVDRLVELIRGYRPELIVSPDAASGAHEHFEHEAVGYLVRKALEELDRLGDDPVRAHLVSVDPYQKGSYRDLVTVSGGVRDPRSSMTYRSIQALALQQHVSQADASVIGLKRLPPLPYEYYDAVRWSESSTLEDWLQPNAVGAR